MPSFSLRLPWIGSLLTFALLTTVAQAQTAPRIDYLFPAGAQRGTRAEVDLVAEFVPCVLGLSVSGSGVKAERDQVEDRFTLISDPQAELGACEVRLFAPQGGSSPFPFILGDLPEITHQSDGQGSASPLKLPVTVNGRLSAEREVHTFPLQLAPGKHLVAAATCSDFGSPLDPQLRLLNAAGSVVAESTTHRTAQALLVFEPSTAGEYRLEIFDFQLEGSPQHIYRLTVTDGPWLDYAFPSGVAPHTTSTVELHGWNLPGKNPRVATHAVQAGLPGSHEVSLPGGANRLALTTGPHAEMLENEPNNSSEQAGELTLPITVHGRFNQDGDTDTYQFTAIKGDRLAIDVAAADSNFPTDPVLAIADATGKVLTELDDTKTSRDPSLRYTVPADGQYFLTLSDRSGRGGDEFVYRLSVSPPIASLAAYVDVPTFTMHSGETTNLAVKVERVDGMTGGFEVTAVDLPAGLHVESVAVPDKPTNVVQLPISADEKLGPTSGLVRVVVRSTDQDPPVERYALVRENAKATTGSPGLWVTVSPVIPFSLSTTGLIQEAPRLAALPFPVSIERQEGFTGAVRLIGVERDKRGTVVPLTGEIAAGENQGTIPLIVQQGPTEGTTHRCRVMGVAEVLAADGKRYSVFHVAKGSMLLGCAPGHLTMSTEPAVVTWQPGETREVRVQLQRRVDMQPVAIRLEPLDSATGISCDPIVLTNDKRTATLKLRFAKDAKIPPRVSVTLQAESSSAGLPVYAQASFRLELR